MNKYFIIIVLIFTSCLIHTKESNIYSFEEKTINFKQRIKRIYFIQNHLVKDSTDIKAFVVPGLDLNASRYWSCVYLNNYQDSLLNSTEEEFYSNCLNFIFKQEKIKVHERERIATQVVNLNNDLIISSVDTNWQFIHEKFYNRIDSLSKIDEVDLCETIIIKNINYEVQRNKSCLFFATKDIDINSNPFSIKNFYRSYIRLCISESLEGYAKVSFCNLSPNFRSFKE